MRAVLDTNVLVSGLFFGGVPRAVLDAWAEGRFELAVSPLIIDEYLRTCDRLSESHPGVEYGQALAALIGHAILVPDEPLGPVSADPDDDKFLWCARRAGAVVVSGDSDLLDVTGWRGVDVLRPRVWLESLNNA